MCLLSPAETAFYTNPIMDTYGEYFQHCLAISDVYDPGMMGRLIPFLNEAHARDEATVVHCSAGQGRTGNVLALWLHHYYHLSASGAVSEVVATAEKTGTKRRPSPDGLMRIIVGKPSDTAASGDGPAWPAFGKVRARQRTEGIETWSDRGQIIETESELQSQSYRVRVTESELQRQSYRDRG